MDGERQCMSLADNVPGRFHRSHRGDVDGGGWRTGRRDEVDVRV